MLGVFYCSEKDRPSRGTTLQGFPTGGTGRLPGKPERNAVPRKGDTMGMARAGNWLPIPTARHHIFSIHTAASPKVAAAFFYSTYFYLFPKQTIKEYIIFTKGVPAIVRVRFFCTLKHGHPLPFRGRAPPLRS